MEGYRDDKSMRLVIDNGSSFIRFGRCDFEGYRKHRNFCGVSKKTSDAMMLEELDKVFDESSFKLTKPHVRGVLVNFDYQMNIWSKLFTDSTGEKNMKGYSLTLSNPIVSPTRSKEKLLEILYEYYGFSAVCLMSASQALSYNFDVPLQLYIESGNGASHVVPIFRNNVLAEGVRRVDVGGKLLTKVLMQYISTKQLRLNDYYLTVENIKESMCFVSQDYRADVKTKRDKLYYVLPDPDIRRRGYVTDTRDDSGLLQYIHLENERFIIPEHIFSPSISNSSQMGLVQATLESVKSVHADFYGPLMKNIILHGGNTLFEGFKDRFDREIRKECDAFIAPNSQHIIDVDTVYKSLQFITQHDMFEHISMPKQIYNDVGCSQLASLV